MLTSQRLNKLAFATILLSNFMELKQIRIKDFKSIRDLDFPIKGNILSLVGKNECGKSSILEAISFLNPRKIFDDIEITNKSSSLYEKGYPYLSGIFNMDSSSLDKLIEISNNYLNDQGLAILLDIKSGDDDESLFLEIERWGNGIENLSFNIIGKKSKTAIKLLDYIQKKTIRNEYGEKILNSIFPNISLFRDEEIRIKSATINQLKSDSIEYDTLRKLNVSYLVLNQKPNV